MAGGPASRSLPLQGPNAIVATLRFNPVPDEDMLPEARKEIADAMWEVVVQNGIDCIFENKLPAQEEFNYTETPLDTVPVLVQHTPEGGTATYTQRDIDRSTNDRAAVVFSNLRKSEMKARILIDYKCVLAVAILKAFKQHHPEPHS